MKEVNPPRSALRILRWYCRRERLEELEGDLQEMHENRIRKGINGPSLAILFWWDVLNCFKPYSWKRNPNIMHQTSLYSSYFKLAVRHIWKNKGPSLINILGLGLALGFCMTVYMMHAYNLEFDSFFADTDNVYRVHSIRNSNDERIRDESSPLAMSQALRQDIPGITDVIEFYVDRNAVVKHNQSFFDQTAAFVSPNFLENFELPLFLGNKRSLNEMTGAFITKELALKYFRDQDPLNQQLTIYARGEKLNVNVIGVFDHIPLNSSFQFDVLLNIQQYLSAKRIPPGDWSQNLLVGQFLRLGSKADVNTVETLMQPYTALQNEANESWKIESFDLVGFKDPMVAQHNVNYHHANIRIRIEVLIIFSLMALLILFTACFNLANTSIAILAKRLREIGIRKTLGSANHQIFVQFLFEMMVTTALALTFAMAASGTIAQNVWGLLGAAFELSDVSIQGVVVFIAIFLVLTTIVAGLFPALYAWKFPPASILRNHATLQGVNWLHKSLIVAQFAFSISVLIVGYTFSRNAKFLDHFNFGFRQEALIDVPVDDFDQFVELKTGVSEMHDVTRVTGTLNHIGVSASRRIAGVGEEKLEVRLRGIGHDYLDVIGVPMLKGRTFFEGSQQDMQRSLLVNERFVGKFFKNTVVIGQTVEIDGQKMTVVGVVQNIVNGVFSDDKNEAVVYRLVPKAKFRHLIVQTKTAHTQQTNERIEALWAKTQETPYKGKIQADIMLGNAGQLSANFRLIFLWLSGLGCFLCIMGIYALVSLSVAKRGREMSIRKILGASVTELLVLINKSFIMILIVSLIIGVSAGHLLSSTILSTIYSHHVEMYMWQSLLAGLTIVCLAVVMIFGAVLRPAHMNPVTGLRQE